MCGISWRIASLRPSACSHGVGAAHAEVARSPTSYRSTSRTDAPVPASSRATAKPAKLAPQISTSAVVPSSEHRVAPRAVARTVIERPNRRGGQPSRSSFRAQPAAAIALAPAGGRERGHRRAAQLPWRDADPIAQDVETERLDPVKHAPVDQASQPDPGADRRMENLVQDRGACEYLTSPPHLGRQQRAQAVGHPTLCDVADADVMPGALIAGEIDPIELEVLTHVTDEVRQLEGRPELGTLECSSGGAPSRGAMISPTAPALPRM